LETFAAAGIDESLDSMVMIIRIASIKRSKAR
jgi:hypothetical protein